MPASVADRASRAALRLPLTASSVAQHVPSVQPGGQLIKVALGDDPLVPIRGGDGFGAQRALADVPRHPRRGDSAAVDLSKTANGAANREALNAPHRALSVGRRVIEGNTVGGETP